MGHSSLTLLCRRESVVVPMSDANAQIRKRIDAFVSELTRLVREAALDAVTNALKQPLDIASLRRLGRTRTGATTRRRGGRSRSGKRPDAEIESTSRQLLDYVADHPGQGIEQIAKALGTQSKLLTLPIKRTIAAGQLVSKGHKRATRYFVPAAKGAAKVTPKRKTKRAKKRTSKTRKRTAKGRGRKKA